jgi:protein-S-isoprenylcysteine O-methyltransferase Ste14
VLPYARSVIGYLWVAIGLVWLVGAFTSKRTARAQPFHSRLFYLALGLFAFLIGFTDYFHFGLLARPFVPASPLTAALGLAMTLAGIAWAVWARVILGGNWSGRVTVKQDHTLVRQGPYAIVRHPIYSGLLLGILGTVIAFREVRGLVATAMVLLLFRIKSRIEERFMTEEFGLEYTNYQRQVKALIPFVW